MHVCRLSVYSQNLWAPKNTATFHFNETTDKNWCLKLWYFHLIFCTRNFTYQDEKKKPQTLTGFEPQLCRLQMVPFEISSKVFVAWVFQ